MIHDPVLNALAQLLRCYQSLAKLSISQHEHVRAGRSRELLEVLAQRQELIDQIADLQQIVGPAKRRWNDFLGELPDTDRTSATRLMDESTQLLEQIMQSDRDDTLAMQQQQLGRAREIRQATAARKFNNQYAAAAYGKKAAVLDVQL